MFISRRFITSICIFFFVIILCGTVEVISYGIHFLNCSTELLCIILMLLWINTIRMRIIDKSIRRLLIACGCLLLLYFVFQIIKWRFFNINLLWYMYYIPKALVPLLAFYVAYDIYGKKLERRKVVYPLLALPSVVIVILILTNDWHQLAFVFTGKNDYNYGPVYFAHVAWLLILLVGLFYFLLKGFYYSYNKKFGLILLLPLAVGFSYTVLYITGNDPSIAGIHPWSTAEIFAICSVAILEICIQMGLIPSNSGYEDIYETFPLASAIYEKSGTLKFTSGNFTDINLDDENFSITEKIIAGGSVKIAVDVTAVRHLNQKLDEISGQMRSRNEHLLSENKTRQERAEIEARNKIYDRVALAVKPQLEKIQRLSEYDFDKNIREIAVLYAYIKRRCNMELLAEKGEISSSELYNAILESSEYIRLYGTEVFVNCAGDLHFHADLIIGLYAWFENFIEGCLENLKAMVIRAGTNDGFLIIRLMISAENMQLTAFPEVAEFVGYIVENQITKEGNDLIMSLKIKGGRK